jgi:hypothetical protein
MPRTATFSKVQTLVDSAAPCQFLSVTAPASPPLSAPCRFARAPDFGPSFGPARSRPSCRSVGFQVCKSADKPNVIKGPR